MTTPTHLPPIGSLWIHKTKGIVVLVRGYDTVRPTGCRTGENNIIKLLRTAENRQTTEITNQFTWDYKPLENGD